MKSFLNEICKILLIFFAINSQYGFLAEEADHLPIVNACCPKGQTFDNGFCKLDSSLLIEEQSWFQLNFPNSSVGNCSGVGGVEKIVWIPKSDLTGEGTEDYDYIDETAVTNDGFLRYNEQFYPSIEYCFIKFGKNGTIGFRLCIPKTCKKADVNLSGSSILASPTSMTDEYGSLKPCVPKCCSLNEVIKFIGPQRQQTCVRTQVKWSPYLYENLTAKTGKGVFTQNVHYFIEEPATWNISLCHEIAIYTFKKPFRFDIRMLMNGSIMIRSMSPKWKHLKGQYCIDGEVGETGQFPGDETDTVIMHCFLRANLTEGPDLNIGKAYYSIMLISAFFLLLTIIVYLILWEKHTIHGFCLLTYFIALFFMEIGFITAFLVSEKSFNVGNNVIKSISCFSVGVFAHFCLLWAFSWMTIANFDLWSTFRNLKSTLTVGRSIQRYYKYFLSALLLPFFVTSVGLGLDLKFGDQMPYERSLILPDYGKRKCYLSNPKALVPYETGPIGVLLALNLFFFFNTVCSLRKAYDTAKIARCNGPTKAQSVGLIAKLIFVMGIFWIFEVISTIELLTRDEDDVANNRVPAYWILFDLINHLQGVLIFIIFICKRDIINSLRAKIGLFDQFSKWISDTCFCCKYLQRHSPSTRQTRSTTMTEQSENESLSSPIHQKFGPQKSSGFRRGETSRKCTSFEDGNYKTTNA